MSKLLKFVIALAVLLILLILFLFVSPISSRFDGKMFLCGQNGYVPQVGGSGILSLPCCNGYLYINKECNPDIENGIFCPLWIDPPACK